MAVQSDIVITAGLDDREFVRSLERMGGYSNRRSWQIAKDFERAEKAKERAARESAARIRQHYQRLQAANQVMTVALAAGAGVVYKAFEKAAEGNRQLRNEMEATSRAGDAFFAQLGDDLTPFLGGLDDAIAKLGRMRRAASDFVAMFALGIGGEGKLSEINYQLDAAARGRAGFEGTIAAQDLEAELFGDGDPDRKYRRDAMERINGLGDRAKKAELRERLRRQLEQRAASRQSAAASTARQRGLDNNARRLGTAARRRPEDYAAQRDAINARFAAERNRARDSINADKTIAEPEKAAAIAEALTLISAEQAEQLENARLQNEQLEKRRAMLEQEKRLGEAQQAVDLARARGRDKEADALALALEYEQRRLRIVNDTELSEERRQRMLANEEAIFGASLGRLGRGTGERGRPTSIAAGFAGDSTTRGQVIGIKSEQRQLVDLQTKANNFLKEIRDNTAADRVAVVG